MPLRRFNRKRFGLQNIQSTPNVRGVYVILDRYDRPQYIGKSNNLSRRLMEHFDSMDVGDARGFTAYQTRTEGAALKLEKKLIRRYCPPYNVKDTEGCYEDD
jgi:excinuclease UvrABC nuclease subunit